MKICIILGTRPEIIKMSPVIRAGDRSGHDVRLVHTGQHYSYEMDRAFFEDLRLPDPHHHLEVGSASHGAQTGRMLERIEKVLQSDRPDVVLVQGDTNTVLAGALAARKLDIRVGHVEAGLRSYDRRMPEETNRVVADHVADLLFAPTEKCAAILRTEGIPDGRIHVTGNTIVDAVIENERISRSESQALPTLGLESKGYILMTAHRQENVDDPQTFGRLLEGVRSAGRALDVPVVYPIHPRSRARLESFGLDTTGIRIVEPVDFLDFLALESNARLLLTDSGGVQEEGTILRVPCVTLRENTERPETVDVGANRLAGTDPGRIRDAAVAMDQIPRTWDNPFGDGSAGTQIIRILEEDPA